MRIGALANAAGTTARAVRHYHRLGLMVEPSRTPGGYREYSMTDLVRLMRIRWLADSGVPLGAISAIPTGDEQAGDDVVDDLVALIEGVDREQRRLAHRRTRLESLLADARAGRTPSALPRPLTDRLAELIDECSAAERTALLRERDLLEVMALSDAVPDALLSGLVDAMSDPEARTAYLSLLGRWAALEGADPDAVSDSIASLACELAATIPFDTTGAGDNDGSAFLDVQDMIPDAAQRAVVLRAVDIAARGGLR